MNAGKVLVVTGASRGIGAAIARLAAAHGYSVCVNYRAGRDEAEAVVEHIRSSGGRAIAVRADTTQPAEVGAMFQTVDRELGPLTALVNNAGISGERTRLQEMDIQDLKRVLEVNVTCYFLCAREAVRRMAAAAVPGGVIVTSRRRRHGSVATIYRITLLQGGRQRLYHRFGARRQRAGYVSMRRPGIATQHGLTIKGLGATTGVFR